MVPRINPSKLPRVSQQFQLIFSRDDRCPGALRFALFLSRQWSLADDFKTINGKVYKDGTISRVEADGIVLRTKTGISKIYFIELPKRRSGALSLHASDGRHSTART
jgi:hypothetical protein